MTDDVKPLTEAQMKHAKKRWPQNCLYRCHRMDSGVRPDAFIEQFHTLVPSKYWDTAIIDVNYDADSYCGSTSWIEVRYHENEAEADWEKRITKLFRAEQIENNERSAKRRDVEYETYLRLKKKFET